MRSELNVMNKHLIICKPAARQTWLCSSAVPRCWFCSCFGRWRTASVYCNGGYVWIWGSSPDCRLIISTTSYSPMTVQGGGRLRRPRPLYGVLEGKRGLAPLIPSMAPDGGEWSTSLPGRLIPGKETWSRFSGKQCGLQSRSGCPDEETNRSVLVKMEYRPAGSTDRGLVSKLTELRRFR